MLRSLLSMSQRKSVLDIACGAGRHAAAMAEIGAKVVGIDLSRAMLSEASRNTEERRDRVSLVMMDMRDLDCFRPESFDLCICLGNSLALLNDIDSVRKVLYAVANLLSEGGKLVVQVLNFDEIDASGFRHYPPREGEGDGIKWLFYRFLEHDCKDHSTLIMVALRRRRGRWRAQVAQQRILKLNQKILTDLLLEAGLRNIAVYADFDGSPFLVADSRNMIVVAGKNVLDIRPNCVPTAGLD